MSDPSIAVYCGSASGNDPRFTDAARRLGAALGARGITLVYGGGSVGLMGTVADAALDAGGEVHGVITRHLVDAEVGHQGLTRLDVVATMHERKTRMVDLADGIVCLPGGFGTMDEMFEALTWLQLGISDVPVVLFDVDGYWAPLFDAIASFAAAGFIRPQHAPLARRATTVKRAIELTLEPVDALPDKWGRDPR